MKTKDDYFNYLLELNERTKADYLFNRMFKLCDTMDETKEFLNERGIELDELLNHFNMDYSEFYCQENYDYDYSNEKINKLLDDEYNKFLTAIDDEWDSLIAEFNSMIRQLDRDGADVDRHGYITEDSHRIVSILRKYAN